MHQDCIWPSQASVCAHLLPQMCTESGPRAVCQLSEERYFPMSDMQESHIAHRRYVVQAKWWPQDGCKHTLFWQYRANSSSKASRRWTETNPSYWNSTRRWNPRRWSRATSKWRLFRAYKGQLAMARTLLSLMLFASYAPEIRISRGSILWSLGARRPRKSSGLYVSASTATSLSAPNVDRSIRQTLGYRRTR